MNCRCQVYIIYTACFTLWANFMYERCINVTTCFINENNKWRMFYNAVLSCCKASLVLMRKDDSTLAYTLFQGLASFCARSPLSFKLTLPSSFVKGFSKLRLSLNAVCKKDAHKHPSCPIHLFSHTSVVIGRGDKRLRSEVDYLCIFKNVIHHQPQVDRCI